MAKIYYQQDCDLNVLKGTVPMLTVNGLNNQSLHIYFGRKYYEV